MKKSIKILLIIFTVIQFQIAPYIFPDFKINIPKTNIKINPRVLSLLNPPFADSIPFSSASATLGNSRLSYRAGIFGTQNSGDVTITIDTSSQPDNNNFHIFPKDTVCFTNGAESGCQGQTTYTVATQIDDGTDDKFTMTTGLTGGLISSDFAVATQSGSMTLKFTTATTIPNGGSIEITVPARDNSTFACDGMPDTASAVNANGFD